VIGAFLNALGILLGALLGLASRGDLSSPAQKKIRAGLGAFTAFCGLQLVWENLSGGFAAGLKQLFLAGLAVLLGSLLGKILGLQKISNWLGRRAAALLAGAEKNPPGRPVDGLTAATVLFCAAPLGLLGAVTDGLADYFFPFALKAVMDGLAMASFVKFFRWPAALAAVPVFFFFSGLTLAMHNLALPWLVTNHLLASVNLTAGLVISATTLVMLEVRRVELANYLPALVVAPLLARLVA
jgi:uncharacterized membrane protein YqgA involved in biofilm formation